MYKIKPYKIVVALVVLNQIVNTVYIIIDYIHTLIAQSKFHFNWTIIFQSLLSGILVPFVGGYRIGVIDYSVTTVLLLLAFASLILIAKGVPTNKIWIPILIIFFECFRLFATYVYYHPYAPNE